jgi:hypothetical protein
VATVTASSKGSHGWFSIGTVCSGSGEILAYSLESTLQSHRWSAHQGGVLALFAANEKVRARARTLVGAPERIPWLAEGLRRRPSRRLQCHVCMPRLESGPPTLVSCAPR